ncbi:MAG: type II secretion system F family protein [Phycisphaerales bacterium]
MIASQIQNIEKKESNSGSKINRTKKFRFKKIKSSDVSSICLRLGKMIEDEIPITSALETIARDQENLYFQEIIYKILKRISKGKSFASSIYDFPNVFNRLAFSIILAGETSGHLSITLQRLASYFNEKDKLAKKLQAATTYPLFVFAFIIFIVIFIMAFIVPRFKMIFEQFGGRLPAFTQAFLGIYDFIQVNIVYLFITLALLLVLSITEKGHFLFSKIKLRIPLIGNLFVQSFMVMFCKTMSILLAAGVSIVEIFDILIAITDNDVIKTAIIKTKKYIIEGSNIHLSAGASGFFPGLVVKMMQVAEESGSLPQVLDKTAEHYERKVDALIITVRSILEPLMIVIAGAIVMIVVIALYLPILMMNDGPK